MKNFLAKKSFVRFLSLATIFVFLALYFQNCGNINLNSSTKPAATTITSGGSSIQATICPSLPQNNKNYSYKISHLFAVNLTTTLYQGQMLPDSNMDGIPDSMDSVWGFDSTQRRLNSGTGVLNSVYFNTAQNNPTCNNAPISPGLTDCDLIAYNVSDLQGLDADGDDIPDLLEILRGTIIDVADATDDNNHNGIDNIHEIMDNQDPNSALRVPASLQLSYDVTNTTTKCNNNLDQEVILNTSNLPLVHTKAVNDNYPYIASDGKNFSFSHGTDDNVIAIIYISEPALGSNPKEMYFYLTKINYNHPQNLTVHPTDFSFLGDIQ